MKNLTKLIATMACAFLAGTFAASAQVTITTTNGLGADTFIVNDSNDGGAEVAHGANAGFSHRVFADVRMKLLYIRFNKPTNLISFAGSTVSVNFTSANRTRTCTVYGLNDGDAGELWDEATTSYSTAPGIIWTTNTPLGQFPTIDTNMTVLGTFPQFTSGDGLKTSDPGTLDLASFLAADTDGYVTLMFLTTSDSSQSYHGSTKESGPGLAPVLTMPNALVNPNLPNLTWAVGNGTWDINTTANWNDGSGAAVYQEVGIGSRVQFDDSASGASPITVTLDSTVIPWSVTNNSTKDYTITGFGALAGGASLTKEGSSTLSLTTTGLADYSGGVNVNGGVIDFAFGTLGTYALSPGPINFNGGTLRYGVGNTDDISVHTVTFNTQANIDTAGNFISLFGPIGNGGAGGLTKSGLGTLNLTGDHTYTGNTRVDAGVMDVSVATLSTSPAIIVAAGAEFTTFGAFFDLSAASGQTLLGDGLVTAAVGVPAGTAVSPGTNGVYSTLTIGNSGFFDGSLSMDGGSFVMDVSNTNNDLVIANNQLTLNGGVIALQVSGVLANGSYTLIQYEGVLGGALGNIAISGFTQAGQVAFLSDATAGQIELVVAPLSSKSLVWAGDGSINAWDLGVTANWLDGGSPSVFLHGDSITLNDSGSNIPDIGLGELVFPSSMTVSASQDYVINDSTLSGGGKVSGATGLTKSGSGKLTVNTPNNNSGANVVTAGTLEVGASGSIGTGAIANDGSLIFSQNANVTHSSLSGTGDVTVQGSGVVTFSDGATHTGVSTITATTLQIGNGGAIPALATSGITNDGIFAINTSSDQVLTTPITGSGGLTKGGTGMLTLSASTAYAGQTRVDEGSVILTAANQVPGSARAEVGGTLDINGFDQTFAGLQGSTWSGRLVNNSGTATNVVTIDNATTEDTRMVIADNDGAGGVIALVKNGVGQQLMREASTYSGGTVLNAGSVNLRNGAALGTGPVTLNPATIVLGNVGFGNAVNVPTEGDIVANSNITLDGPVTGDSNSVLRLWGDASGRTISFGGGSDFSGFNGTILVADGTNDVFFRFNGGNGSASAIWNINTNGNNVLSRNGNVTIEFGHLIGGGRTSLNGASSVNNGTTYEIGALNLDGDYPGFVQDGANSDRFAAISKVGTGTFTFLGTNTYSGPTTVSGGVLALSGAVSGAYANPSNTTAVTASAPGTLDVSGLPGGTLYVGGNTNLNVALAGDGNILGSIVVGALAPAATVTPGNAGVGVLTVTNALTLSANAAITMELDRDGVPTSDQLAAASITIGGAALTVTNIGAVLQVGDTFTLFNQAVAGFGAVELSSEDGSATYTWINNLATDGTIEVATVTPKVDPTPTELLYTVDGGNLTLGWPVSHTGWTLQNQTNELSVGLSTNWVDLGFETTNSATFPIDETSPTVFYRLTLP